MCLLIMIYYVLNEIIKKVLIKGKFQLIMNEEIMSVIAVGHIIKIILGSKIIFAINKCLDNLFLCSDKIETI